MVPLRLHGWLLAVTALAAIPLIVSAGGRDYRYLDGTRVARQSR